MSDNGTKFWQCRVKPFLWQTWSPSCHVQTRIFEIEWARGTTYSNCECTLLKMFQDDCTLWEGLAVRSTCRINFLRHPSSYRVGICVCHYHFYQENWARGFFLPLLFNFTGLHARTKVLFTPRAAKMYAHRFLWSDRLCVPALGLDGCPGWWKQSVRSTTRIPSDWWMDVFFVVHGGPSMQCKGQYISCNVNAHAVPSISGANKSIPESNS